MSIKSPASVRQGDQSFTGSIPDIYDDYMVPLKFQVCAVDMARRVAALAPYRVLETAAGSGVVTRALAPQLPAGARYTATDLNPSMLERAKSQQPHADQLSWHTADMMELPFEDRSFEVVCCQFGVMFLPDKLQGYREALRVLAPGGHYVFSVWDHIDHNDFARSVTAAAARVFPDDPPDFMPRIPHGYHDVAAISANLREAGFKKVEAAMLIAEGRADSAATVAKAFCQGTPLRNTIEERGADLDHVTARIAQDLERQLGKGPVRGKLQARVFTASA